MLPAVLLVPPGMSVTFPPQVKTPVQPVKAIGLPVGKLVLLVMLTP